MAAREYAFTLTPGHSSRTRSLAIACAAIAAVCVLSSTLVMRELVGGPTARAATPATAAPVAAVVTPTPTAAAAAAPVAAPGGATGPGARAPTLEPSCWAGRNEQRQ